MSGVSHGVFQTSTDGTTWTDATSFTTAQVTAGHVRFLHDGGEVAPTFSIKANDGQADSNSVSGQVTFSNVNDAPAITSASLPAFDEDTAQSPLSVASIFAGHFSDADSGASLGGIAVNLSSGPTPSIVGTWQYSTDNGSNWLGIGPFGQSNMVLVLNASTLLKFVPVANYNGGASLSVYGVDNSYAGPFTDGASLVKLDFSGAGSHGGSTPFSLGQAAISTTVNPVNDAPAFSGLGPSASNSEQAASLLDGDLNATVFDPELHELNFTGGNWAGATLTVARHGGANPEIRLASMRRLLHILHGEWKSAQGEWQYLRDL